MNKSFDYDMKKYMIEFSHDNHKFNLEKLSMIDFQSMENYNLAK